MKTDSFLIILSHGIKIWNCGTIFSFLWILATYWWPWVVALCTMKANKRKKNVSENKEQRWTLPWTMTGRKSENHGLQPWVLENCGICSLLNLTPGFPEEPQDTCDLPKDSVTQQSLDWNQQRKQQKKKKKKKAQSRPRLTWMSSNNKSGVTKYNSKISQKVGDSCYHPCIQEDCIM